MIIVISILNLSSKVSGTRKVDEVYRRILLTILAIILRMKLTLFSYTIKNWNKGTSQNTLQFMLPTSTIEVKTFHYFSPLLFPFLSYFNPCQYLLHNNTRTLSVP